ncbi:Toll-interacting protein [Hondaea fermentalgiana]|uniref:Toll-interacting protein n=1 Tax=Hondaea fermentalgiana TaxID=2315210 RepID=A0A2R5G764_9STRA|nr:Toll-interacting protein [Hondaea fermentalgiana]|eukprot:GBG26840.1 Toll-interacting protein [Hondaea fermentalgiana]
MKVLVPGDSGFASAADGPKTSPSVDAESVAKLREEVARLRAKAKKHSSPSTASSLPRAKTPCVESSSPKARTKKSGKRVQSARKAPKRGSSPQLNYMQDRALEEAVLNLAEEVHFSQRDRDDAENLRKLAWGLKYRLDRTESEKAKLEAAIRAKAAQLRKAESQARKARKAAKNASPVSRRRPRHVEVLAEARALELDYFGNTGQRRPGGHAGISRRDRMAIRARVRTAEEERLAAEYEFQRREEALAKEEERQRRKAEKRRRHRRRQQEMREQRLRELHLEYQQEWSQALGRAHPSAVRSRPLSALPATVTSLTSPVALGLNGTFVVCVVGTQLHTKIAAPQADLCLRLTLLPEGQAYVFSAPFEAHAPARFSRVRSHHAMQGQDAYLHLELHDSRTLLAAAETEITDCVQMSSQGGGMAVTKQVILSNSFGIERSEYESFASLNHHEAAWAAAEATFDLHYPGAVPEGVRPSLQIQVGEAGVSVNASAVIELLPYLGQAMETHRVNAQFVNHAGAFAGNVELHIAFADGPAQHFPTTDPPTPLFGASSPPPSSNVLQPPHVIKQDPYVRAELPDGTNGQTKVISRGGVDPTWDAHEGTIELRYNGLAKEALWPSIDLFVLDKEMMRADQHIGQTRLWLTDLSPSVVRHEIPLSHEGSAKSGGTIVLETWFRPDEAPHVWSAQRGVLTVQVSLPSAHLRATLLPWNDAVESQNGPVRVGYPGAPPAGESPWVQIEVAGKGFCSLPLTKKLFQRKRRHYEVTLKTKDGQTSETTRVTLSFEAATTAAPEDAHTLLRPVASPRSAVTEAPTTLSPKNISTAQQLVLQAIPIRGRGLRIVQHIGKQDPFVKLTHLRTMKSVKCKCHANGGSDPSWDIATHQADLRLALDAVDFSGPEQVLIEVFDAELIMQHRMIGSAVIDLWQDVLRHPSHGTEVPLSFRLLCPKGSDAGLLQMQMALYDSTASEGLQLSPRSTKQHIISREVAPTAADDNTLGVPVRSIWMRLVQGELESPKTLLGGSTMVYAVFSYKSTRKRFTKRASASTGHPLWPSGSADVFVDGIDADAGALATETVNVTLFAKRLPRDKILGSCEVPLYDIPYVYEEEIEDFCQASRRWIEVRAPKDGATSSLQASARIQALRRLIARRKVNELRQTEAELEMLDSFTRLNLERAQERIVRDTAAAVNIQRYARGTLARKRYRMARTTKSVVLVQSLVRGFRQRKAYRLLRKSVPRGSLRVRVIRAFELRKAQWIGRQDPYVRILLEPGHHEKQTKVHNNGGQTPKWDQILDFDFPPSEDASCLDLAIKVSVFDKTMLGKDKLIGACSTWNAFKDLVFANETVRDKQYFIELDEKGTVEVRVSWIPESHFLNAVARIQAILRAKLAKARYQVKLAEREQAVVIQRQVRAHLARKELRRDSFDSKVNSSSRDSVLVELRSVDTISHFQRRNQRRPTLSVFAKTFAIRATLRPKGTSATSSIINPQHVLDHEILHLEIPVMRSPTDWPTLEVELLRPSLLGTSFSTLARAELPLLDEMHNRGEAIPVALDLVDTRGAVYGVLHASIAFHYHGATAIPRLEMPFEEEHQTTEALLDQKLQDEIERKLAHDAFRENLASTSGFDDETGSDESNDDDSDSESESESALTSSELSPREEALHK